MADIRREKQDGSERLAISGDLTVAHAAAIAHAINEAVQTAPKVEIVVEQVTAVDITFPQTLCSAHRTAAGLDKELTVHGQSEEPLGVLLRTAGFLRHIGCQDKTRKTCLWQPA